MIHDVSSILIVILLLAALFLGLRVARARKLLSPEASRKGVHIGMGCVTAMFPWMFSSAQSVAFLALLACGALFATRRIPALNDVIRAVDRESKGEYYFPIGVAFAFYFSRGEPSLYCPPVLMLTFADSVAALIGKPFGRRFFTTHEDAKTWEGTAAFMVAAFTTTFIFLALFSPFSLGKAFMIALLLSMVGAMIESISCQGVDNLYLPVFGVMAMVAYRELELQELIVRLVALPSFVLIVFLWKRRSTMNDSALIATALILYVIWALAGWVWVLSPFGVLLLYPLFVTFDYGKFRDFQSVPSVLFLSIVPFWWLIHSFHYEYSELSYWAYSASWALHLSMIWTKRAKLQRWNSLYLLSVVGFPALSTLAIQGFPALLGGQSLMSWESGARLSMTFAMCGCASLIALSNKGFDSVEGVSRKEWAMRIALSLGGSSVVFFTYPIE